MKKCLISLLLCCASATVLAEDPQTLRVATDATFAPFHFIDQKGTVTGFDVELARAVARHAGFSVEILVRPYDELFTGLDAGSHDLVAATTGITAEREQHFDFSAPYFDTCQAAVVRTGFGEPLHVIQLAERRIGASGTGTSANAMYETQAAEHVSIPEGEGVNMLQSRRIDAWIVDEFDAVAVARGSHGELAVLPEPVATERYGFVMARGSDELKARLDASLAALSEDRQVDDLKRRFGVRRDAEWPVRCR